MVETISWMVTRESPLEKRRISRKILAWFIVGGFLGGALAGLLVAGLASVISAAAGSHPYVFAVAAAVVALAYLGNIVGFWHLPKPQVAQQVPSSWRDVLPPPLASVLYSAALGLTFVTRVGSLALFPMVVVALGLGKWPLAIMGLFAITGVVRAVTALIVPVLGWIDVSGIEIFTRVSRWSRRSELSEAVVLALCAAALVAVSA